MAYCLPKEIAQKFAQAIHDGEFDPNEYSKKTSTEDRRAYVEQFVGKNEAVAANAELENKMVLQDWKRGMVSAVKKITGISSTNRSDLLSQIEKMKTLPSDDEQKQFYADATAKRLKITEPSQEQAQQIVDFSKKAQAARDAITETGWTPEKGRDFGKAFISLKNYVDSLKPQAKGVSYWASQIINLPKSTLTSVLHFSAPLVQARGLMATKPWAEAFGNQFKYYASSEAYNNLQADIIGHPNYKAAVSGGLGLTKLGDKLSSREEAIQSSLLEHVPGLKIAVLASSRAFTGFLNEVRFKNFSNMVEAARLRGEDVSIGSQSLKDIATTINNFSGRGSLGGLSSEWQPKLNNFFFSPRKISATIQMFNPVKYLDPNISTTAKLGALKYMAGTLITQAAILEMAHLAGASVSVNPTSTDFGKLRLGKTTIDMTGGSAVYARLLAREIEGQATSASGKTTSLTSGKYGSQTRLTEAVSFFENKLAPAASLFTDFLLNQNPASNYKKPFNLAGSLIPGQKKPQSFTTSEMYDKFTPIVISQFINFARSDPKAINWLPALLGVFGAEVQTPEK